VKTSPIREKSREGVDWGSAVILQSDKLMRPTSRRRLRRSVRGLVGPAVSSRAVPPAELGETICGKAGILGGYVECWADVLDG